jgi:hypothetical protein
MKISSIRDIEPSKERLKFREEESFVDLEEYLYSDRSEDKLAHRFGGLMFGSFYDTGDYDMVILFNSSEPLAMPAFTNMISNGFCKEQLNDDSSDFCIRTSLQPMEAAGGESAEINFSFESFLGFIFTMLMLLIGYTITLSVMARSIVYEKKLKIKVNISFSFFLWLLMNEIFLA